jgi:hypothetical protein
MALPRSQQKFDRLTITLVPTSDERSYRNVPSTFSAAHRTYVWRRQAEMSYMLVPRRISSREITVDIFVDATKKKAEPAQIQRLVSDFIKEKVHSEWRGLKLQGIARAASAQPPDQVYSRGTIEEILGARLEA